MKVHQRAEKKAGSALLVVLGFLSFMVVSAVAFAIYMRSERVPSSALRRNTTTRHLVKAALAHAMSRVDDAIRSDPFPGLANTNDLGSCYRDFDENVMDMWYGRVFMPPNPEGLWKKTSMNGNPTQIRRANDPRNDDFSWRFAPVTETVSVLNLEALGYLPPPLVNDVRFLSRSSWTAKWQNFSYDAGRFAFCAVNVSDYFDINRTRVGIRSSPLDSNISLSGPISLKRTDDGLPGKEPKWEMDDVSSSISALENVIGPTASRPITSTMEYISMLDYNLAFGSQNPSGPLNSPFYRWVDNKENNYFYGGVDMTDENLQRAMRQPFVSDSFSAVTNVPQQAYDIGTIVGQPFHGINMKKNGVNSILSDLANKMSGSLKLMADRGLVGDLDLLTLFDYLDHDDVPISLALPSVESVPMVTTVAVSPTPFCNLTVKAPDPPAGNTATEGRVKRTTKVFTLGDQSFNPQAAAVGLLVAFPFRHLEGRNIDGFKAQVVMKVFVAAGAVPVRPDPSTDLGNLLCPKEENDWTTKAELPASGPLLFTLHSQPTGISIPDDISDPQKAVLKVPVGSWLESDRIPANTAFLTTIEETPVSETGVPTGPKKDYYELNFRPFLNGALVPGGRQEGTIDSLPFKEEEFKTYVAVWVRILNNDGKTVDLVPAIMDDDKLNGRSGAEGLVQTVWGKYSGTTRGMLLFANKNNIFTYANLTAANGTAPDWEHPALACADPRYNYAPEDWYYSNNSALSQGTWLSDIDVYLEDAARDPDIFMFTSNQGYLQSLGEFAFLPWLSEWRITDEGIELRTGGGGVGSHPAVPLLAIPDVAQGVHAADARSVLNKNCVWRTYPVDRRFYRACEQLGIVRKAKDIPAVNPYSEDMTVLAAAFANTPCDYWTTGRIAAGVKSDNDEFQEIVDELGDKNTSGDPINNLKDALESSFCEKNVDPSSKMEAQDVLAIARNVSNAIRAAAPMRSWESVYDELFENALDYDDAKVFMGASLNNCPLYSTDRKFLYSYWRECFANKQQLFLIFVRAEATALGGPGEGTPSQQGGRAVALVWRDPQAYNVGTNPENTHADNEPGWGRRYNWDSVIERRPHRMRVLFYHQFD